MKNALEISLSQIFQYGGIRLHNWMAASTNPEIQKFQKKKKALLSQNNISHRNIRRGENICCETCVNEI